MINKTKIDHVGIICTDLDKVTDLFSALGFVFGSKNTLDSGLKNEKTPTNLHFVFDNAYIECIQTTGDDYLSPYLQAPAGLNIVVFSATNIEQSRQQLLNIGYDVSPAVIAKRNADHGAKKGTAIFNWIKIENHAINHVLLGAVNHETKELIYQKERYIHPNSVNKIKSLVLYDETGELEQEIQRISDALIDDNDLGIPELRSVNKETIKNELGLQEKEANLLTKSVQNRAFIAVVFTDFDRETLIHKCTEQGLSYFIHEKKIILDLSLTIGLFFIFEE